MKPFFSVDNKGTVPFRDPPVANWVDPVVPLTAEQIEAARQASGTHEYVGTKPFREVRSPDSDSNFYVELAGIPVSIGFRSFSVARKSRHLSGL
jgi:hypothetical protein